MKLQFYVKAISILLLIPYQVIDTTNSGITQNSRQEVFQNSFEKLSKEIDSLKAITNRQERYSNWYSSELSFHNGFYTALIAILLAVFGWGGWTRINNKYKKVKDYTDDHINEMKVLFEKKEKEMQDLQLGIYNNFEWFSFENGLNCMSKDLHEVSIRHFIEACKFTFKQIQILEQESVPKEDSIKEATKRIETYLSELDDCIVVLKKKGETSKIGNFYLPSEAKILKAMINSDNDALSKRATKTFVELENLDLNDNKR